MGPDLNVSQEQLSHALSVQIVGLAMGCLLFIPLTKKYGRRPTYILATAVMAAMSFWAAEMKSVAELFTINLFYGLSGSMNETVVQMTIADLFFVHQRGSANAAYIVAVMVGSFLTTMAAGAQAERQGWRWSYRAVGIALTVLAVLFVLFFEESKYVPVTEGYPSIRDPSSEDSGSAEKAHTASDIHPTTSTPTAPPPRRHPYHRRMRLLTPTNESYGTLLLAPARTATLPHVLYTAIQYANAISFLVLLMNCNSILLSAPPYNFTVAGVGYMALGPFVGNVFGSIYGGPLNDWLIVRVARRRGGYYEPETRLWILGVPAVCMAGGIGMYGVTVDRGMHWVFPAVAGGLFAFGLGSIGDASFTLVIDSYREVCNRYNLSAWKWVTDKDGWL
jgi:MFS family permease